MTNHPARSTTPPMIPPGFTSFRSVAQVEADARADERAKIASWLDRNGWPGSSAAVRCDYPEDSE